MSTIEVNLSQLWGQYRGSRDEFVRYVRSIAEDSYDAGRVSWCANCDEIMDQDDSSYTHDGSVCESCYDDYTYCETCDDYYHDRYSDDHDHGCCCSPQMVFAVRNDGDPPLAQDTRTTITLPSGVISEVGLAEISGYLRGVANGDGFMHSLSYDLEALGDKWQTKEGNFTKRLSRLAYKTYNLKLTPEVMSQVGCIASAHSTAVSLNIEVTRDLNLPAHEFYHDGSCWWGSYSESRCALKSNGGFGIRSFGEYGQVTGRVWVLPLKSVNGNLRPTFETLEADAFVTFNGYGELGQYVAARVVAHMAGMTYRKIGFGADPMYVNSGGYLVAPEAIAEKYTDGSLCMSVDCHADLFYQESREKELAHA